MMSTRKTLTMDSSGMQETSASRNHDQLHRLSAQTYTDTKLSPQSHKSSNISPAHDAKSVPHSARSKTRLNIPEETDHELQDEQVNKNKSPSHVTAKNNPPTGVQVEAPVGNSRSHPGNDATSSFYNNNATTHPQTPKDNLRSRSSRSLSRLSDSRKDRSSSRNGDENTRPGRRKSDKKRQNSNASFVQPPRREAVLNVVFTGRPDQPEDAGEDCGTPGRKYLVDRRASSVLSRLMTPVQSGFIAHGDYPVLEEDDRSVSRMSLSRPATRNSIANSTGFLYQIVDFENFTENVPSFVRQDIKKNGRLTTETFILKVNYLRRRRQLGETSSTMSPGSKKAQQQTLMAAAGGGAGDKGQGEGYS
ncbi:uncharacterized protein LOC131934610 [Physella acuta]|uniref:uncharacterized protein LOC131934610 n=1 Tax=Physella acuta TaxID=109671 RepID=UPI0027DADED8|nr:uncharacterized protein LOC131934610 [Physella acuta]XP_059146656.1 uncharacterized protein LOC131934610 [Physella acuta]